MTILMRLAICLLFTNASGQMFHNASISKKPTLSIMAMLPLSASQQRDGKLCKAAMEYVMSKINNEMKDILPNYLVEATIFDEGANGARAVRQLAEYGRAIYRQETTAFGLAIPSPVFVGPISGVGCQRISAFAQHFRLTGITFGCSLISSTANRRLYPNMYRTRIAQELASFPRLKFIMEIGNWSQIAVIVNATNQADFELSAQFQKDSRRAGVSVIWFNAALFLDEALLQNLKDSESRIIVLGMVAIDNVLQFFCEAYNVGITGYKYVFIAVISAYSNPYALPDVIYDGCTRETVIEQMKYTFWIGSLFSGIASENTAVSRIGVNLERFDSEFAPNLTITADYERRHSCGDAMLQAVLTLDEAEKNLNKVNLTLSRFVQLPIEVSTIVNDTAAQVEYLGFRIGQQKYSERLEVDDEPQYVAYWTPEKSFHVLHRIRRLPKAPIDSIRSYKLETIVKQTWLTPNRQAPRDESPPIILIENHFPDSAFGVVMFLASALSFVQALLIGQILWSRNNLETKSSLPLSRSFFLIGCLALNVAAITFAFTHRPTERPASVCWTKFTLAAFGITTCFAFLVGKLVLAYQQFYRDACKLAKQQRQAQHQTGNIRMAPMAQSPAARRMAEIGKKVIKINSRVSRGSKQLSKYKKQELTILLIISSFLLTNAIILVAWFKTEPLKGIMRVLSNDPTYDELSDNYYRHANRICFSQNINDWLVGLGVVDLLLSGAGMYLAYTLKVVIAQFRSENYGDLQFARVAMLISSTILLIAAFLIGVMPLDGLSKSIVACFSLLCLSLINMGVMFYNTMRGNLNVLIKMTLSSVESSGLRQSSAATPQSCRSQPL